MTAKRFTVHIRWFNYDKTEGDIELKDNGQPLLLSESIDDVQWIKTLLNELHEENTMLKERRHEDINDLSVIAMKYKALEKENEQLKQRIKELELLNDGLNYALQNI